METNNKCQNCTSLCLGIFNKLDDKLLTAVSDHKITNTYKKGQTLFMQGNPPFGIYCIKTGVIKVTQTGKEGKESIVRLVKAGDTIGHRSLFSDEPYQATATAVTETKVCFYDKSFIQKLVDNDSTVALNLISHLSKDLGAAEHKLTSFSQKSVRERLAELLILFKDQYGVQEEGRIMLNIKLTREEMASIIGTASETLIRFFSELKTEGIVSQEGKTIYILDEEKLSLFSN